MSKFHIFEKTVVSKGNNIKRWYFYYTDYSGKTRQKVCKDCQSKKDAIKFANSFFCKKDILVKDVASDMYLKGGKHLKMLSELGKNITDKTILCNRRYINIIIEHFGNVPLNKISVRQVVTYLMNTNRSGSWKNNFCEVFSKIYDNAIWYTDEIIQKPKFPTFTRNSKKADILTTEELSSFFNVDLWNNKTLYLLFLCTVTCGLRIGEVRALQARQFDFENNALIIDGFCKQNGFRTNYNKCGSDENSRMRVVMLSDLTSSLSKQYIAKYNLKNNDFVFTKDLRPYRSEHIERVFKRQLVKANIETSNRKLTPHSLRYTYVTRMRRSLDIETVQKLAGHSSSKMTEYYTRIAIPEMIKSLKKSIPAVNDFFN